MKENKFLKRVTLLSVGQGLAQVLPVLSMPFIARLYTPSDLGELTLYIAASNIVTQFLACKYDFAITVADSKERAGQLALLSMVLTTGLSLVMLLFIPIYPKLMKWVGGSLWLYFLPMGGLLTMLQLSLVNLSVFRGNFAKVSAAAALRSGVYCLLQLSFYPLGAAGLILARFGGDLASGVFLWKGSFLKNVQSQPLWEAAKNYRNYPQYMVPGAVAAALSGNAQNFFLSAFYSSSQTGSYGMVNRLLGAPVSILSSAIGQVFLRQSMEELQLDGRVRSAGRLTLLLTVMAVGIFGSVWLAAPWLIPVLLGAGWPEAVGFLRIQALLYGVRFVAVPVTLVVPALGKQKATMLWQFSMLGLCLLPPLMMKSWGMEAKQYLLMTAAALSLGYLVFLAYCLKLCGEGKVTQYGT